MINSEIDSIKLHIEKYITMTLDSNISKILIIGSSGVGKSSLVNLLIGKNSALVSDSPDGGTDVINNYKCNFNGTPYEFVDTIGFSLSRNGKIRNCEAISKIISLSFDPTGYNCILFVIKSGRINELDENIYKLFVNYIFDSKIPIGLIVNQCDEKPMNNWYINHKELLINKYKLKHNFCVCTTSKVWSDILTDNKFIELREESKNNIYRELRNYKSRATPIQLDNDSKYKIINLFYKLLELCGIKSNRKSLILKELKKAGASKEDIELIKNELKKIKKNKANNEKKDSDERIYNYC